MKIRSVESLAPVERQSLFDRDSGVDAVRDDVRDILDRVRTEGDVALRAFAEEFDGVNVGNIEVTDQAERAVDTVDDSVRAAIEDAAANVRSFHERQVPDDWLSTVAEGRELGRRFSPIENAGVYAPGGTAAYPSSVLMGVVPAKVAGVEHVAVATPPAESLPEATLAAAEVAGADAVFQVGGAQAIGALAYGTETVPPVEKVVGPGNKWVTAAKAEVRDAVAIDFLAGPSEVLVLADRSADPDAVAADMVAQAEHDPEAPVGCVTGDETTAEAVVAAVDSHATGREREETIRAALGNDASGVFLTRSTSEAVLFAESYAPEHLSIQAEDPEALLDRIPSAGSAFLGRYSPVAAGDYATGTNHVLPTGGGARVVGGLSVDTFLRSTTVQRLSAAGLADLRETVTTLADVEGLEAHAHSVDARFDEE